MSLLPAGKTFSSPNNPLFATQAELAEVVSNLSTLNVTSGVGSGITVTEPTLNTFNLALNLSNAGGISFLQYPGVTTVGLSNAGVTGLVAGSGIGVSGATGNVTVSNTGVNSVTAGTGITVGGTASAPVVNNTIASGVNVVQDQYNTTPIAATTPVNGAITPIVSYGSLVPGKTYLICLNVGVALNNMAPPGFDFDKTMSIGITFAGIGEIYTVMTAIGSNTGVVQNATCAVTIPAGLTSLNVIVSGFGLTGETVTGTIYNSVIIPMN
jgi:hypothetical protein